MSSEKSVSLRGHMALQLPQSIQASSGQRHPRARRAGHCITGTFCVVVRGRSAGSPLGAGLPRRPVPVHRGARTGISRDRRPSCTPPTAASSPSWDSSAARSSSSSDMPPIAARRVRRRRGQALLRARRHRLASRARRARLNDIKTRSFSEGFSTITMQLARQHLPRAHHRREKIAALAQAEGDQGRARHRARSTRRIASSSCTSIRSISATARTASRRPRSGTSASPLAI